MRIGISAWGFNEKTSGIAKTPDGHRYGRPILIDALVNAGHKVLWMQERRDTIAYPGLIYTYPNMIKLGMSKGTAFPDIDILFVEHRWPTYKNSGQNSTEPDLQRQTELLNYYEGKIPVVVWDTDLKLTAEEELRWPRAIIADPTRETKFLTRERTRLPFWTDNKRWFKSTEYSYNYTYVGNNYERDDEFKRYYVEAACELRKKGIQTIIYGNWLERSPERSDPSELIAKSNNVSFGGRLPFWDSMSILNQSICTTHISKLEYYRLGFISPRYLENIACNVPALVPVTMSCQPLGAPWCVHGPSDIISRVTRLSLLTTQQREEVVNSQAEFLHYHTGNEMMIKHAVSFLESLV